MGKLTAALVLGALILFSSNSFAWFEICNTKSNGADMYVTYAYYEPNTTTLYTDACGSFSRVFSPQYLLLGRTPVGGISTRINAPRFTGPRSRIPGATSTLGSATAHL